MKCYRLFAIVIIFAFSAGAFAQTANVFSTSSYIGSYTLEVTYNKTTHLVFPASIISVDRGSQDILVQKASGVENILKIKAGVKDFAETSLSVITADGKLYSFVVCYSEQPSYLNINVERIAATDSTVHTVNEKLIYSDPGTDKTVIAMYADSVLSSESNMHAVHTKNSKVSMALTALYIHSDLLFCRLDFKNKGVINYDIDQLHFYIRDKKEAKRTSSQEIEALPLYISGDTAVIKGKSGHAIVIALPMFTIPDGKYLSIEMMEKNGGRNLLLKIKNRHIMKSKSI